MAFFIQLQFHLKFKLKDVKDIHLHINAHVDKKQKLNCCFLSPYICFFFYLTSIKINIIPTLFNIYTIVMNISILIKPVIEIENNTIMIILNQMNKKNYR